MSRLVPRVLRGHRPAATLECAPAAAPAITDIDGLPAVFHEVWVQVPCAGCGGAHEMTCAELLARQLTRGAGWDSEECDDSALLRAILSPEEAATCGDSLDALCAALSRKGIHWAAGPSAAPDAAPVAGHAHHILHCY